VPASEPASQLPVRVGSERELGRTSPLTRVVDGLTGAVELVRDRVADLPRPDVAALGRTVAGAARRGTGRAGGAARAAGTSLAALSGRSRRALATLLQRLRSSSTSLRSLPRVGAGLRGRLTTRRGLLVAGAVALALIVVVVLLVVLGTGGDGGASGDGSTAAPSDGVAPVLDFPAVVGTPAEAVARVRPVAVRNVAIDFEAAIEGVSDLPACDAAGVGSVDRAAWFDAVEGAMESGLVAVAPGEAGTALLRVRASDRDPEPFGAASIGQLVEVARANGSVLRWDVVATVDAPAGAPFPTDVLSVGAAPRLVLLACGASVDRYVLTVPAR